MYDVDVNAIEEWFESHCGKDLAVDIDEEEQYDCLINSLISAGHFNGEHSLSFRKMISNTDIVEHGGKVTVSFYLNDHHKIQWTGFCWRGYYERYSGYVIVPFEEFLVCSDFEFDQKESLLDLLG